MDDIPLLLLLAPLFIIFEAWQLVISERYLGVKTTSRGLDPRALGPSEPVAFVWSALIVGYWIWMICMLVPKLGRAQVITMLVVSLIGYSLRRTASLKWVLVILTIEGAIRIGMLVSLLGAAWQKI